MKKLSLIVSLFISFIGIFSNCALSSQSMEEQEAIRQYLRNWAHQINNVSEVQRQIGDTTGCLRHFIKEGSTSSSDKVLKLFEKNCEKAHSEIKKSLQTYKTSNLLALPQLVPLPPEMYCMPLIIVSPRLGAITPNTPNLPFEDQQLVSAGINRFVGLHPIFLLNLPYNQFYSRENYTQVMISSHPILGSDFNIRLYGPDDGGRFGTISTTKTYPLECFALAIKSEEPRKNLPIEYESGSGADGSHLLDCAQTPFPNQLYNSNKDPLNFLPEGPILNQQVRRSLTQLMGFRAYRVIYIKEKNPLLLKQRRQLEFNKKRNKWSRFEDGEVISVPTSSIFLGAKSIPNNSSSWDGIKVYYLPENKLNAGPSIYERYYLEAKQRNPKATYKTDVIPRFEVNNVAHYFLPMIHDLSVIPQEREVMLLNKLYLALNVHPFFRDTNNSLRLLDKLKLPYSWNFAMGLTSEEVEKLSEAIFSESSPDPSIVSKYPYWNGLCLPTLTNLTMNWEDAAEKLIPVFPATLSHTDVDRFSSKIGEFLLEQVAKSPDSSCRLQLFTAEIYIEQQKFEEAFNILQFAYYQIEKKGSLSEALWLTQLCVDNINKFPSSLMHSKQQYKATLYSLIDKKKDTATLEERLRFRKFFEVMADQLTPVNAGLETVSTLTPKNSKILRKKYVSVSKIPNLKEIINSIDLMEEFSLQDVIFTTPEYTRTIWLDDDDSVDEDISHEDYYWNYKKPFEELLLLLSQKHLNTIEKLNFTNLGFGLLNEYNNKVIYDYDLPNILKVLQEYSFPNLRVLHLTGSIDRTDIKALNALQNLKIHFPLLEKIFFAQQKEETIQINPEKLSALASIFRRGFYRRGDLC